MHNGGQKLAVLAVSAVVGAAAPALAFGTRPKATAAVTYRGEPWHNASGGVATGSRYLDNLDVTLELDGAQIFGVPGLTLFGYALYNNGAAISELTGTAQGTSSIEAVKSLRLYEAWLQQEFAGRQSVRFGLYDLNSDFDAIDSAGLFTGAPHGMGAELAQTGANGPSIFPVAGLALRWRLELASGLALQAALLEGTPGDPDDPRSSRVRFEDGEGALLVGEVQYSGGRLNKAALGYWRYTAQFPDLLRTDVAGEPIEHAGNDGLYAFADVRLAGEAAGARLDGWVRVGGAADDFNQFDRYLGAGVVWTGAFGRGGDRLGIVVASARNGRPYRDSIAAADGGIDRSETIVELTWQTTVTDWLIVQPTVQYALDPGTDSALDDSLACTLRFEIAWSHDW